MKQLDLVQKIISHVTTKYIKYVDKIFNYQTALNVFCFGPKLKIAVFLSFYSVKSSIDLKIDYSNRNMSI